MAITFPLDTNNKAGAVHVNPEDVSDFYVPTRDTSVYRAPTHPASVAVQATSTQIVAANANRQFLLVQNNGSSRVWLSLGTAAVAGQGICLEPSGHVSFGAGGLPLYRGAIYGIADVAGQSVSLTEDTRA